MTNLKSHFSVAVFFFLSALYALGLTLGSPFTDKMVLQRDQPLPVWGWDAPDTQVTVEFAGQEQSVKCDADGKWSVTLDPVAGTYEGRPFLVKSASGAEVVLSEVVVGDVWICSGQSNMQFGRYSVPEAQALEPTAKNIRTFHVPESASFQKEPRVNALWVEGIPSSAVAFTFAYHYEKEAGVPIGIILTCWGSTGIEAWMPREMTEELPHFKTMMEEFDANNEHQEKLQPLLAKKPQEWTGEENVFIRRQPNIVYNAMMHPLIPYGCRGILWYQGERNTQTMKPLTGATWFQNHSGIEEYGKTLKAWVKKYRKDWGKEDLEFMVVMLPGCGLTCASHPERSHESPIAHSWAWMREQQLSILDLPHTAVVNTIDLGEKDDVHPKDKAPIGERAARIARKRFLDEGVKSESPTLAGVKIEGGQMTVSFTHAESLKTSDGEAPKGFWISADAQNWVKADAQLSGKSVVLKSAELKAPKYIRYAFVAMPDINLYNEANLPVLPFRTDSVKP